MEVTKYDFG